MPSMDRSRSRRRGTDPRGRACPKTIRGSIVGTRMDLQEGRVVMKLADE